MSSQPHAVVGAGIGGVAAALAMARRGSPVVVLEQAPEIGEIGAGVQLGPNALRILDRLGVLDPVYDAAVFPPAACLRDATTAEILTQLVFDEDFTRRYGYPYVVTHRSDLHKSLVAAALETGLVELRTDTQVVSVGDGSDDGSATLCLSDGTELPAPVVIGADGLHSVIREHVAGADAVRHLGDVAYRGTVPYDAVLERDGKDDMTWWVGPGMHLIQYPVRRKELYNQVAVFTTRQIGAPEEWGTPEELDERFADKHELVRQGASLLGRDRRWLVVDRDPVTSWTRGRVTLLGDAAHPMVQYLAQAAARLSRTRGRSRTAWPTRPSGASRSTPASRPTRSVARGGPPLCRPGPGPWARSFTPTA